MFLWDGGLAGSKIVKTSGDVFPERFLVSVRSNLRKPSVSSRYGQDSPTDVYTLTEVLTRRATDSSQERGRNGKANLKG